MGFASAADRQRIETFLRRGKRSGLCSGDVQTIAELVDRADDELFEKVLCNPHHVLCMPVSCHFRDCKRDGYESDSCKRRYNKCPDLYLFTFTTLPYETVSFYELRHRPHNRELINKTSRLVEASFIVRMLYKDIY